MIDNEQLAAIEARATWSDAKALARWADEHAWQDVPVLIASLREALATTEVRTYVPAAATRRMIIAVSIDGILGAEGWLVTLECGHKIATREKRGSYACAKCKADAGVGT